MAKSGAHLITIGIKPSGPETGYGYIERGSLHAKVKVSRNFCGVTHPGQSSHSKEAKAYTFLKKGGSPTLEQRDVCVEYLRQNWKQSNDGFHKCMTVSCR